jgi:tRNA pseudouridine55 synthase
MPVAVALSEIPEIALGPNDAARIGRGQPVLLRGNRAPLSAPAAYASHAGQAIALGEISEGQFHPTRVFRPG